MNDRVSESFAQCDLNVALALRNTAALPEQEHESIHEGRDRGQLGISTPTARRPFRVESRTRPAAAIRKDRTSTSPLSGSWEVQILGTITGNMATILSRTPNRSWYLHQTWRSSTCFHLIPAKKFKHLTNGSTT